MTRQDLLPHGGELRERIRENLATLDRLELRREGLRDAAVALTLVPDTEGGTRWILTRRQARLSAHAGQLALPGGRCDTGETEVEAALRELEEELGMHAGPDSVLGRLDDFATRSGYLMHPVVVWCDEAVEVRPDPSEVSEVFMPRLTELLRDDAPRIESIPQSDKPIVKMPVEGDHWVNAPTAAIVYQFREVGLLGQLTRVAHFEQPSWAWR